MMKKIKQHITTIIESLKHSISSLYTGFIKSKQGIKTALEQNGPSKNRVLILFFTGLFLFDYLIYSIHTEKNPLNIFPPLPVLERTIDIQVFLPSPDGESLLEETRQVPSSLSENGYISYLFDLVRIGSVYENTRPAVPADLFITEIFIYEDPADGKRKCVINLDPLIIPAGTEIISGSEDLFKKTLEKTIVKNIPEISKVYVLERGLYGKRLWEI